MQYKMILAILLLPSVSYGNQAKVGSVASSIESLKQEKDIMEHRAVLLGAKIIEEQDKLMTYKERVYGVLWQNYRDNENKETVTREQFNKFVLRLCGMFAQGEDIKPLTEKVPFFPEGADVPLHLMFTGLVVQQLFVKSLMDQYAKETEELRLLNKKLHQDAKI